MPASTRLGTEPADEVSHRLLHLRLIRFDSKTGNRLMTMNRSIAMLERPDTKTMPIFQNAPTPTALGLPELGTKFADSYHTHMRGAQDE